MSVYENVSYTHKLKDTCADMSVSVLPNCGEYKESKNWVTPSSSPGRPFFGFQKDLDLVYVCEVGTVLVGEVSVPTCGSLVTFGRLP